MAASSVCIRECVYDDDHFCRCSQEPNLNGACFGNLSFDDCVMYESVVVYECMECKLETRNSETHHIHTLIHTQEGGL
jgi:hypothetical protein